jgi:phosphate starvation-inducible PhoH-like protein
MKTLSVHVSPHSFHNMLGNYEENLKFLEDTFSTQINYIESECILSVSKRGRYQECAEIIHKLNDIAHSYKINIPVIEKLLIEGSKENNKIHLNSIAYEYKTERQREFANSITDYDITFAVGEPGTGRTFISALMGLKYLVENKVDKLVISRPCVTSEDIGYLPGNLYDKLDPFLKPLLDIFKDVYSQSTIYNLLTIGKIERMSIAHMKGLTFKNSFVIFDEAEDMTEKQMYLTLTRFGENSKFVYNGDLKQKDLRSNSGLKNIPEYLKHLNGVNVVEFTDADIVRHPLVRDISLTLKDKSLTI